MRALVCFHGGSDHPLAWLLKDGFRHCFVCLENNGLWLLLDGAGGVPTVRYLCESDFDLVSFYRDKGMTVVETDQRAEAVTAPFALRNCVGLCKAMLCIRSWAVTPFQLFKSLTR